MILAGIDEAGYGPLLGPLVVGCCAFEIDGTGGDGEIPCLWKTLRGIVSKNKLKSGRKLHVNDSKLVYSPAFGLKDLERAVLAMSAQHHGWADDLPTFVQLTTGIMDELLEYSWYQNFDGESFPIDQSADSIRVTANALKVEMQQSDCKLAHLAARVIPERRFNTMVDQTRNKSAALFSIAAGHIDHLLKNFGERDLILFIDQQGGRQHYASLLRMMFDDWSLEIQTEGDGFADYRLSRSGHVARLIFSEKCETRCMSVALASMLSKYLREALMNRFNAWWRAQLPELRPTAGYYNDGLRFLQDIAPIRRQLQIPDHDLIRCR